MKAFLSHSSNDKQFVLEVYNSLGASQAHLDSATFEKAVLNVEAISKALEDSDIFVLFLSDDSLGSSFVNYESLLALENLGEGKLSRIMMICIDKISLGRVDERLRKLNIVTQVSSVGSCTRRIQSALIELSIAAASGQDIFVGRELESKNLRKALTRASTESPAVLVLSGIDGVGRRTLAQKVFRELLPPFSRFAAVTINRDQGLDDLFRSLLRVRGRTTMPQLVRAIMDFSGSDHHRQMSLLHHEIECILNDDETILFLDFGGLMDDEGGYHSFIIDAFQPFYAYSRPCAIFIQRRMPPISKRKNLKFYHFERVQPLTSEETRDLLGARLRSLGLTFSAEHIDRLEKAVSCHPINVDFALDSIVSLQGDIDLFLSDTSDLVTWRNRRALDFLSQISFTPTQRRICGLLLCFQQLTTELIITLISEDVLVVSESIRFLMDHHIIENDDGCYFISAPIIEAMKRSRSFDLSREEERHAAGKIIETTDQYRDNDDIHRALVEPAIIASLRSESSLRTNWGELALPSHFLVMAREAYDHRDLPRTIQLCRESLSNPAKMPDEAKVECYRMLGLSAIRLQEDALLREARAALSNITTRYSKQVNLFLKGFSFRSRGFLPEAEEAYLQCFDVNERNFSVCRELAQVYLSLGRPDEAETYAKIAFDVAPNNHFIIDILVGVILGKYRTSREDVSLDKELKYLLDELKKYGHGDGKSFYSSRMAEFHILQGNASAARRFADEAVRQTPWLIPPYIVRANVYLMKGNERGALRDIEQATKISSENTSYGNLFRIELFEIELEMLITKRQYRKANNLLERVSESRIPRTLLSKFEKQLAIAIKFDQNFHDTELIRWAQISAGR